MPNQVHQALLSLQNEWPKIMIGAVIPASQYAWKFLREHRDESRKRVLRGKVKELAEFLHAALPATGAERIKSDAEHEYAETISQLSDICDAKKPSTPVPASSRNWIQRCFLLYVPQRPLAWIPQTIFFIFLSFTVLGFIGVAADPHDPDIASGILGLSIFAALTALIRFWAVRANATSADPAASPWRPPRWLSVTVIVSVLLLEFFFVLGISLDDNEEFSLAVMRQNSLEILISAIVVGLVVFFTWYWRRRSARIVPAATLKPLTHL